MFDARKVPGVAKMESVQRLYHSHTGVGVAPPSRKDHRILPAASMLLYYDFKMKQIDDMGFKFGNLKHDSGR